MPICLPPINRRRFLAGSLAASAGWLLPARGWRPKSRRSIPITSSCWPILTWGHNLTRQMGLHLVTLPAMAWLFDPSQPRGFVTAQLRPDGATLVLHALDRKHPKHGETIELKWRT